MTSSPQAGQGSKSTSRDVIPGPPYLPPPPLAAIFVTYFHDTQGPTVIHYITIDETRQGNIEHTTLPSGLHLIEGDCFGFRHGTNRSFDVGTPVGQLRKDNASGDEDERGDGSWPGIAFFTNRSVVGGRGRKMISFGVILANPESATETLGLKRWLYEEYSYLDEQKYLEGEMSPDCELFRKMEFIMREYGCKKLPICWSYGQGGDKDAAMRAKEDLRRLAGGINVSEQHPISYLPRLVDLLGPAIVTVYKAAITGKRILIYSPPPLFPLSAFGWCIAALSLPPSSVQSRLVEWVGQVGLMDLGALHARKGGWVASTSDKILLSNTRLYDLSIDLSSCNPLPPQPDLDSDSIASITNTNTSIQRPKLGSGQGKAQLHITSPSSSHPISTTYTFTDIPLYKLVSKNTSSSDWWITFYDLYDRVYSICSGVCQYAVGRGQVGSISLSLAGSEGGRQGEGRGDEEEDNLLQHEDEDGDRDEDGQEDAKRGQMILKQFYHHSYHLHALLQTVITPGQKQGITMGQVRELTGKWRVTGDDYKFWSDLARRWMSDQTPPA